MNEKIIIGISGGVGTKKGDIFLGPLFKKFP